MNIRKQRKNTTMAQAARQRAILQDLTEKGFASVAQLAEEFPVSLTAA